MTDDIVEAVVGALERALAAQGLIVERRETHISLLLLAGDRAYKFRKAVDFGFLDFSTPERRHASCLQEVALNAPRAPGLYLGVVAFTDTSGTHTEHAVEMQRFAEWDLLSARLTREPLVEAEEQALMAFVATLHANPVPAPPAHATAAIVHEQVLGALSGIAPDVLPTALRDQLQDALEKAHGRFVQRHAQGLIAGCHGDLHTANVVWRDGTWQAFDGIDFNDALRCIDPASDIAFLLMDLEWRHHHALARQVLGAWLTATGDFTSLGVLDPYIAYRALVRAKVACLSAPRAAGFQRNAALATARSLIALATRHLQPRPRPTLTITHGVSASGKSRRASALARRDGVVHLRADLERRRLAGLALDARSNSETGTGLYTAAHTLATYDRLATCTVEALLAGFSVVVDATFLRRAQRVRFRQLAAACHACFEILDCDAPEATLRERLRARLAKGADPSEATEAVLDWQLANREPLDAAEGVYVAAP